MTKRVRLQLEAVFDLSDDARVNEDQTITAADGTIVNPFIAFFLGEHMELMSTSESPAYGVQLIEYVHQEFQPD